MEKTKKIYTTVMLIIVVSLITFILTTTVIYKKIGTIVYTTGNSNEVSNELIKKVYALKKIIDSEYIYKDVKEDELVNSAIKGYVAGLDDGYTEYFTKEEMESFKSETEGNYFGIGIYMYKNTKTNEIGILYPIEGSPAEIAGLKTGDIIKKVDDLDCNGDCFENISTYIKGKEGSKVKIKVQRGEEELEFEVERQKIELYPIKSEILENNIGYIKLPSFDENSGKEFKKVYNELKSKNIKSLVIDLRNNGGGIVSEALEIADYILEKDSTIIITKNRDEKEVIEKSKKKPIVDVPIVILTNNGTASASEILTAALKENNKATVIGKTTYGKGVIQELISLSDGSGIKITIEEYYTPNRNKIHKIGIEPDKEVSLPDTVTSLYNLDKKDDSQLQEAINFLNK